MRKNETIEEIKQLESIEQKTIAHLNDANSYGGFDQKAVDQIKSGHLDNMANIVTARKQFLKDTMIES